MKGFVFSMAGLGVGGAALFAGADSPDFDRVVSRPPTAVYAAFSALGDEGESEAPAGDFPERMTQRVAKVPNESIRYEVVLDGNTIFEIDVNFEPVEGGAATRVTAEMDLDKLALGGLIETEAGVALALVPDSFFDSRFAEMMGEMTSDVEAGRSLAFAGLGESGVQWRHDGGTSVSARRAQAESAQRRAAAPMVRPEPMVDPNRAARDYLNGR